jgi:hypothetical protein
MHAHRSRWSIGSKLQSTAADAPASTEDGGSIVPDDAASAPLGSSVRTTSLDTTLASEAPASSALASLSVSEPLQPADTQSQNRHKSQRAYDIGRTISIRVMSTSQRNSRAVRDRPIA